ncbi:MAG: ABC transporter permease [Ectothiorhodospiraceae bacterium]|nr:ABC transporter permease [Chromatiales bacterium]MCP5154443.1 ABC transporter permease [Ectothiorhodospiraceae bacterium]
MRVRRIATRVLAAALALVATWQVAVWVSGAPAFILPSPLRVASAWWQHAGEIVRHLGVTVAEIVLGLGCGLVLGVVSALLVGYFRPARRWLLPVLVASQAVPVFALAPVLVLWLGYGMASKVGMATLIIYFPVTVALLDGLRRTEPGWLDLARTMTARGDGGPRHRDRIAVLRHIQLPAALPAFASGVRVAASVAPIGAVVGEWVGSSAGLGYLMLHANGRMQIDLMFAALATLAAFGVALWFGVDAALRRLVPWQADSFDSMED